MENGNFRRHGVVLVLLAAAAVITIVGSYAGTGSTAPSRLKDLPDRLGDWQKEEDIQFDQRVLQILGTSDVISRVYRDGANRRINLIVVRAVNNRSAFHPPEYCLTGGGSELLERRTAKGGELDVNEMVFLPKRGKKLFVWNWYVSDKGMTSDFYRQQFALLCRQMCLKASRGAAVNLYTDMENDDEEGARAAVGDFSARLVPIVGSYL